MRIRKEPQGNGHLETHDQAAEKGPRGRISSPYG